MIKKSIPARPEPQADQFTSKHVCAATGVRERTLQAWQLRGLLKIEARADGEKWRRYTFADVIAIALMSRLTQTGFSARHAADCVNGTRERWEGNPAAPCYLTVRSTKYGVSYFGASGAIAKDLVIAKIWPFDGSGPDMVTVIAVHRVAQEIQTKLS